MMAGQRAKSGETDIRIQKLRPGRGSCSCHKNRRVAC